MINSSRKNTQRKVIVLGSLVTVLSLTSALLLALAPAPLNPDAASSLFAIDAPQNMDVIFQTDTPVRTAHWKYILVHHSRTPVGNALTLATGPEGASDHFVIGNGDGCVDGEIQITQRWNRQSPAAPPQGARSIDPECVTICLVGDFDKTVPTPTQLRRLQQLVNTLQAQLHISSRQVRLLDEPSTAVSAGKYFPVSAFNEQLIR